MGLSCLTAAFITASEESKKVVEKGRVTDDGEKQVTTVFDFDPDCLKKKKKSLFDRLKQVPRGFRTNHNTRT